MVELKDGLIRNVRNFFNSANKVYADGDYTSSCVLYCKCLFAVLDYVLLTSGYGVPKDHGERFRVLQRKFSTLYTTLDKIFPIYQKTYSTAIDKSVCDFVSNYVKRTITESGIKF